MRFLPLLIGSIFYELLQHGRKTESAIKSHDTGLLTHFTPALERYVSHQPGKFPQLNALSVATLLPLFLIAFAFNLLHFLHALPGLSPPLHALSFFVPSLMMIAALLTTSALLARGFTMGLTGFLSLFLLLLALTVLQGLYQLLAGTGRGWPLAIAACALLGCRILFNSRGFVLFTIYCRTQRLFAVMRKIRLKSH